MAKMTRRTFLWLTGGSGIALASNPQRKLVNRLIPLVVPPEHMPSGEWSFFATTCRECPAGCGMHLWHRDGRVTKAEGNPKHPVNRGTLCARGQSALQGLYDPDRIKTVTYRPRGGRKEARSWEDAFASIGGRLRSGGRVAILSNVQTGAFADVMERLAAAFGPRRIVYYEPFHYEALKRAHGEAFGAPVIPDYRIDRCQFVISFAADFLETWISPVSFANRFGDFRSWKGTGVLNRMAYVGPRLSMTAANADDFIQVPPGYERLVAVAMLKVMIDRGWTRRDVSAIRPDVERVAGSLTIPGVDAATIEQLARWFSQSNGSVALAGPVGSSSSHAVETAVAAAFLNYAVGGSGDIVDFSRPHALGAAAPESELDAFFRSLGPQDILFVHGGNPVYSRPGAADSLARAGLVVCLGTLSDETAEMADWVLPIDSPLEAWGEYESSAGINGLMQPTLSRITDSKNAGDVLLELARRGKRPLSRPGAGSEADFPAWLRARWDELGRSQSPGTGKTEFWTRALRDGGSWGGTSRSRTVALRPAAGRLLSGPPSAASGADEVQLWPWGSIFLYDGRTANRGWIQESADPLTFITWGNWVDLHPATAGRLKIRDGDTVELSTPSGNLRAPVRLSVEVVENTAAIAFGQGHQAMGRNARKTGANVFGLLGPSVPANLFPPCRIRRVGGKRENEPTYTSPTREQHNRQVVQWVSFSLLRKMGQGEGEELKLPLPEGYTKEHDLYPQREYLRYRWSMVVDLQRCIGCGACTVACYAENNIPVMGKKQVGRQLEMAWLRVPPYRKPDTTRMRYSWLPLLCQHCDSAPCEPVCPVYASVHNEEGLNAQIYNRCIGTRYCSNNCPYKVRRFNWLNIAWDKPLDLQLNPEVTVRSRGVMEKCTFCIQRIRQAEYRAVRENRRVRDGEITPACAQTCPTGVFTFGDLLDPQSRVSKLIRTDPRRYQVLQELNTKPGVIYLRRIDNDVV